MPKHPHPIPIYCAVLFLLFRPAVGEVRIDLIGQWGGATHAVAQDDRHVFFGVGPRLVIADVLNPSSPAFVGQTPPLGGLPVAIALGASHAFVGLINGNLCIVDIRTPANPTVVAALPLHSRVIDIATEGDLVFASTEQAGVWLLDVGVPESPEILYHLDNPYWTGPVELFGQYAYCFEGGMRVLDITDPRHPETFGVQDQTWAESLQVRAVAGERLGFFAEAEQIKVVWVSDPWIPTPPYFGGWSPHGGKLVIDGAVACVAGMSVFTRLLDDYYDYQASVPSKTDYPSDISLRGGVACQGDWYQGLQVVDVSDPFHPINAAYYDDAVHALYVDVSDDLAFVSGYRDGVHVIDITDPTAARRIAIWPLGRVGHAQLVGHIAYLAGLDGLSILDATNMAEPALLGHFDTSDYVLDLLVEGTTAYLADYHFGLRVLDVSDPAAPTQTAAIESGIGGNLAMSGSLLLMSDRRDGLVLFDISEPLSPRVVSTVSFTNGPADLAVSGDHVYVSHGSSISVVDISNPTDPRIVRTIRTAGGWGNGIAVTGEQLHVSDGGGLRVLDIHDPTDPRPIGTYRCQAWNEGLAVADGFTVLAANDGGLEFLVVREPGDIDGDQIVGLPDLAVLLGAFGTCREDATFNALTDLNSDGCVSVVDLAEMLAHFGQ